MSCQEIASMFSIFKSSKLYVVMAALYVNVVCLAAYMLAPTASIVSLIAFLILYLGKIGLTVTWVSTAAVAAVVPR